MFYVDNKASGKTTRTQSTAVLLFLHLWFNALHLFCPYLFIISSASGRLCFVIVKKRSKRKVQGMPQLQTAANSRHLEKEETDKTKQA